MKKKSGLCAQFGSRVREIRTLRSLSQEALADKCRLDRTYVGGIERGERNPSLNNLGKLARALEVTLADLMKGIQ